MLAPKCLIDTHTCDCHAGDACNCVVSFVSKGASFNLVWSVFTSFPVGCRRRSRRGRREGVNVCGAAVQAAIVTGEGSPQVLDFLLLDVTLWEIRLATSLGVATKLCECNTDTLTKNGQMFRTVQTMGQGFSLDSSRGSM